MSRTAKSAALTHCVASLRRSRLLVLFLALALLWSQHLMLAHATAMAASPGADVCMAAGDESDAGGAGGDHQRHCNDCCCSAARLDSFLPGTAFVPPRPAIEYVRATPARAAPAARTTPYRSPPSRAPPALL